ncbi:MAG: hypothetical protein ACK6A5_05535 [Flavobacteriales bacterium]|jgi:hypothetical protein
MNTLRSSLLVTSIALCIGLLSAQTTVTPSSFAFSNGVHPTFSFVFEGTDVKYVESYWRDELKRISANVSAKKEVIAAGALLPQVSTDTVRILVKAEQRKNSPLLTAHVAILTTAGYVGPTTNERAYEAARAFVQQHSTALRRQLAQQELTSAEKGLSQLRTELNNLQRERERANSSIEKSRQRAAEAVTDQQNARATMDQLTPRIEAKRVEVAQTPSDAGTKELNDLLKQQTKAQDTERKALETERNMVKKGEELELQVKKYDEDELRKQEAIARQETLVGTLREKLDAIR